MSKDPVELLARNARRLRESSGLTQQQVSDRSNLHVTYIARVEAGSRNPSLRSLVALARGLGVQVSKLVEGIDG